MKSSAEKVLAVRRRDNLGGTAAEATLLVNIKDKRKALLASAKANSAPILDYRMPTVHIPAALSTCRRTG